MGAARKFYSAINVKKFIRLMTTWFNELWQQFHSAINVKFIIRLCKRNYDKEEQKAMNESLKCEDYS